MRFMYAVHIAAGALGLIMGYVALYAAKGARAHRTIGMIFVYAMLTMSLVGALLAALTGKSPAVNIPAAVITAYLVITGLATVRTLASWPRWLDVLLLVVVVSVSLANLKFGIDAIMNGGKRNGIPAFPFFLFAAVGFLASIGDVRMIRVGGLGTHRGSARLARHLWRLCFALFIASLSFFIGQAKVIPKPIRIYPLLALPPLLVLAVMCYWLWRVRSRRALRGVLAINAASAS